jgi:hypothetical protein
MSELFLWTAWGAWLISVALGLYAIARGRNPIVASFPWWCAVFAFCIAFVITKAVSA